MTHEERSGSARRGEADDGDHRLEELPTFDLDATRTAHLRRQATALFVQQHDRTQDARRSRWAELYGGVLEPAWVAVFCLAYLGWALVTAASLHG